LETQALISASTTSRIFFCRERGSLETSSNV
jgi:hypothetical protein